MDKFDVVFGCMILFGSLGYITIEVFESQGDIINANQQTIDLQNNILYSQNLSLLRQHNLIHNLTDLNYNISLERLKLANNVTTLTNHINDYKDIIIDKDELYANKKGSVRKPTYQEVIDFLDEDQTDRKEWTLKHDCTQFAHEVIRNAYEQNIYGCVVTIDLTNRNAHDIIAFDTSDIGIVYFEPQTDKYVYMYPGMDYASYLGYSEEVSLIVRQYDSCFERRTI